jgi:hypothetical protein
MKIVLPKWRKTDPVTSEEAAKSIPVPSLSNSRKAILDIFKKHKALHDEDLGAIYSTLASDGSAPYLSPSGLRSRRAELRDMGYLEDSGDRGKTYSGRSTIIWKITQEGKDA